MNGRMKKYKESLDKTLDPILLSQHQQVKMVLQGMMKNAKEHEKRVIELTEEEKKQFIFE